MEVKVTHTWFLRKCRTLVIRQVVGTSYCKILKRNIEIYRADPVAIESKFDDEIGINAAKLLIDRPNLQCSGVPKTHDICTSLTSVVMFTIVIITICYWLHCAYIQNKNFY